VPALRITTPDTRPPKCNMRTGDISNTSPFTQVNVHSMTDEAIIRKVQAGDLALFGALHERYYKRVYGFIRLSVVDEETAKDIAAETFVNAYRSIHRYEVRKQGAFGSFLLRIARNLVIDHKRAHHDRYVGSLENEDGQTIEVRDTRPSPLESMLEAERIRRVQAALESLPPGDREILALAYQQRLSLKEIMAVLEKPSVSSVTSQINRAMGKLRKRIRGDEYFTDSPLSTGKSSDEAGGP